MRHSTIRKQDTQCSGIQTRIPKQPLESNAYLFPILFELLGRQPLLRGLFSERHRLLVVGAFRSVVLRAQIAGLARQTVGIGADGLWAG